MTDFESRSLSRSRAAPSRPDQRLPLSLNRMSSLSIVRDLVKKVLHARKNLKTRYPDEDDDDPD
jgi:hypothetical protein